MTTNTYTVEASAADYLGSLNVSCYIKATAEFGFWSGSYDANKLPNALYVDYVKSFAKN